MRMFNAFFSVAVLSVLIIQNVANTYLVETVVKSGAGISKGGRNRRIYGRKVKKYKTLLPEQSGIDLECGIN